MRGSLEISNQKRGRCPRSRRSPARFVQHVISDQAQLSRAGLLPVCRVKTRPSVVPKAHFRTCVLSVRERTRACLFVPLPVFLQDFGLFSPTGFKYVRFSHNRAFCLLT